MKLLALLTLVKLLALFKVSTAATTTATTKTTTATTMADLKNNIMNIYHYIHHIEISHGTHPDDSVLLDLTRRRLSTHFGIDYNDLLLGLQLPIATDSAADDPPTVVNNLEQLGVPVSNEELYGIHPFLRSSSSSSRHTFRSSGNVNAATTDYIDDQQQQHQQQQQTTAKTFAPARSGEGDTENFNQDIGSVSTTTSVAQVPEPKLSRALAKSLFGIDEDYTDTTPRDAATDSNAGDDKACTELCECMASELLFGITKTLPYLPGVKDNATPTATTALLDITSSSHSRRSCKNLPSEQKKMCEEKEADASAAAAASGKIYG